MTINDLAKLYDRLTPRERLPLIIAASERGDEAAACLRRLGAGDAKVPTIEGSFQAMRAVIDQRVAWWNVDKG